MVRVHLGSQMQTIIVTGLDRGGTSAVAGLLRIIGIDMGENIDVLTHEDNWASKYFTDEGEDLIKKRNKKNIWGFKLPNMINELDKLERFRSPLVILVTRDPLASASFKEDKLERESFLDEIKKRTLRLAEMFEKVVKKERYLLVSYEKLIIDKEKQIRKILDFIHFDINEETMEVCKDFLEPSKGYYPIPR